MDKPTESTTMIVRGEKGEKGEKGDSFTDYADLLVRENVNPPLSRSVRLALIGLVIVLILSLSGLLVTINSLSTKLNEVSTEQDAGAQRGFKIKAVGCATLIVTLKTLDGLPATCLDADTLAYYDPATVLAAAVKQP